MKNLKIVISIIFLIWGIIFYTRYIEYNNIIDDLTNDLNNISIISSEQINLAIMNIDGLLKVTLNDLQYLSPDIAYKLMRDRIKQNLYIKELVITDAEGTLINSSADATKEHTINYSDRVWYKNLISGNHDLIISPIVKSRIHGGYTVPFIRGIFSNDNKLIGTVILTINMDYFDQFYKKISLNKSESINIIGMDEYYRFRKYSGQILFVENGKSEFTYKFFKNHNFENGIYYMKDTADGIPRYVGIQKLNNYPLFVEVGESYYEHVIEFYIETFMMISLIIFFTIIMIYNLKQERKYINNLKNDNKIIENKNEELINLKELSEESDKLKARFIGRMSHKLKNPLNIIIGYTELLSLNITDKKTIEQLGYIKQSAYNLLDIISSLLDVSRNDTLITNNEVYYINESISECLDIIKDKLDEKCLKFTQIYNNDYLICADKIRTRQILLNIFDNSIKFTNHGGEIIFEMFEEDEFITVIITDTGNGMDENDLNKAMQIFGQNTISNGIGIGLPLTKKIIESMGGVFEITSVLNIGTCVTLKFVKGNFN